MRTGASGLAVLGANCEGSLLSEHTSTWDSGDGQVCCQNLERCGGLQEPALKTSGAPKRSLNSTTPAHRLSGPISERKSDRL